MALIIETGVGVVGANSYVTLAEARAYYAERNYADMASATVTDAQLSGYLIEAADFLNSFYSWNGLTLYADQGMALPTDQVTEIPVAVKQAQMMLARQVPNGPLAQALGARVVSREVKSLEGVGSKEIEYSGGGQTFNAAITGLLRPYVSFTSGSGIQTARIFYR